MLVPISSLIQLYLFPPGRGIHALERVAVAAALLGLAEIAAQAQKGIAQYRRAMDLQTRLRIGRTTLYGTDTFELDNQLDRGLTALDDFLGSQLGLFPRGHRRADAADTIRPALFPEGVAAITNQPFVQQRVAVDLMIEAYMAPPLAPARADLTDLDVMIARVAEINHQYGASIDAYDRDRPSSEELRAAQALGQTHLAETVVLIAARHVLSPPEQQDAVAALLEPILRQNDAIRAIRRRRRPARDVDPGTGIELPDEPPGEPVAQPAPAA
jgi:hypothetical protein